MKKKKQTSKTKINVKFEEAFKAATQTYQFIEYKEQGMTIAIEKLPECDHKKKLLEFANKDARICVIATRRGVTNNWVAYAGYPDIKDTNLMDNSYSQNHWDCENIHDVESVKMLGETLDAETAATLFPDWDIKLYSKPDCVS